MVLFATASIGNWSSAFYCSLYRLPFPLAMTLKPESVSWVNWNKDPGQDFSLYPVVRLQFPLAESTLDPFLPFAIIDNIT